MPGAAAPGFFLRLAVGPSVLRSSPGGAMRTGRFDVPTCPAKSDALPEAQVELMIYVSSTYCIGQTNKLRWYDLCIKSYQCLIGGRDARQHHPQDLAQ